MPRKSHAQENADKYREEQEKFWCHGKSNLIFTVLCLLCSVAFGIAVYLIPSPDFSEDENRMLADFPEISVSSISDGSFSSKLGSFYSDRFPARGFFTSLKAVCTLFAGRMENNGVIYASGHRLISRLEYNDYSLLEKNLEALNNFVGYEKQKGVGTVFFVAPRAIDINGSYLPEIYDTSRSEEIWKKLDSLCPGGYITANDTLSELAGNGEYVFYSTDHHWTTAGAYEAYRTLCPYLGAEPFPADSFTRITVSENFLGTTYSKFSLKLMKKYPDSIELYRYENDEKIYVINNTDGSVTNGFYDFSALDTKDKYSVFLGGNDAHLSIKSDEGKRPTVMVIKDSYANSVIPFLARHFDLEIVDLRYYRNSVRELAERIKPEHILVLYGADTVQSDGSLCNLRLK